jgi:hypothetical protein
VPACQCLAHHLCVLHGTGQVCRTQDFPLYIAILAHHRGREPFHCWSLQVRSAGDDAWLGGPAPEDPALDAVDESPAAGLALACGPTAAAPGAITPGKLMKTTLFRSLAARSGQMPGLACVH